MSMIASVRSLLSPRRLRATSLALVLASVALVAGSTPALAWAPGSFSPDDEALLLTLTNQDRASAGLSALANDTYLHKEAEWRAKDMGDRDYFSHTIPPSNIKVFDDMQKDHYCFKVAGENIGLSTFGDDAATTRIEKAFMASKTHRANILGNWKRIGVGAYKAADGRKLYAVLFSIPCTTSKPRVTPKATPKPTATPTTHTVSRVVKTAPPSATPTPTGSALPTATPTASPTPARQTTTSPPVSMRVREKGTSDNAVATLLHFLSSVFGG